MKRFGNGLVALAVWLALPLPADAGNSNWVKLCGTADTANRQRMCIIHHERLDGKSGALVISVGLRQIEDSKKSQLVIVLPNGYAMRPGLRIAVYDQEFWIKAGKKEDVDVSKLTPVDLAFTICRDSGCVAEVDASPELIQMLTKGAGLMVLATQGNGTKFRFPVPLDGFKAAFDGPPADNAKYETARAGLVARLKGGQAQLAPAAKAVGEFAVGVLRPEFKVKDTWVVRNTTEDRAGTRLVREQQTVVRSTEGGLWLHTAESGGTAPAKDILVGPDWGRMRSVNGKQTLVARPLAFPLTKGKTWTLDYTELNPNISHRSERFQTTYKVAGPEQVTVLAGTFNAIRIEAQGTWTAELSAAASTPNGQPAGAGTQVSGHVSKVYWYLPEAKRFARSVEDYFGANGTRSERFTMELESFKVDGGGSPVAGHQPNDDDGRRSGAAPGEARMSTGTGFFVSNKGHILTNAHVAAACGSITVAFPGTGTSKAAQLLAVDKANDLALLTTSELTPTVVPALSLSARTGEDIAVYGFPLTGALSTNGNYTTGLVAATTGLQDNSGILQISAPVQPGNSGGPVLDRSGNVVGVVVAKLNALAVASAIKDIPQNVNFAIKSSVVLNFLEAHSVPHEQLQASPGGPSLSNPDLADRAKAFTLLVSCRP